MVTSGYTWVITWVEVFDVYRVAKDGRERVPYDVPCFLARLRSLTKELELGTIHLSQSFPISILLVQSLHFENSKLSLKQARSAHPHSETTAEHIRYVD